MLLPAAQCGHAAAMVVKKLLTQGKGKLFKAWEDLGQRKVVLKATSKEEMVCVFPLHDKACSESLRVKSSPQLLSLPFCLSNLVPSLYLYFKHLPVIKWNRRR